MLTLIMFIEQWLLAGQPLGFMEQQVWQVPCLFAIRDMILADIEAHSCAHLYNLCNFNLKSIFYICCAAGPTSVQLHRGVNVCGQLILDINHLWCWQVTGSQPDDGKPELSEADIVVFLGDFNYRLHGISYDEARDMVSQRCFDWLREKDQLRAEMKAGKVFQGMREGQIKFPPTYKFERHQPGLSGTL
ncbi:hypothetical protein BHM03_00049694 [Ensete ventricosum]|nr:hypothetical protein BHM03_00049694 [Ensete ventricosum]